MPCRKPLPMYLHKFNRTKNGLRHTELKKPKNMGDYDTIYTPCGKCLDCRLKQSLEVGIRCQHELALCKNEGMFLTITVDDEHMQEIFPRKNLQRKPIQLFNKKLRRKYKGVYPLGGKYPIRILYSAEYGETTGRPYYHAIIFNFKFDDLKLLNKSKSSGEQLYTSEKAQELWPYGQITIGEANSKTGQYVGGYVAKGYHQLQSGALRNKKKPFIQFPNRPALGVEWFNKHKSNMMQKGFVWKTNKNSNARYGQNPSKVKLPKRYNKEYAKYDPAHYNEIIDNRIEQAIKEEQFKYKGLSAYKDKILKTKEKLRDYETSKRNLERRGSGL